MEEPVARWRRTLPLLLVMATLAVYLPGLAGDFMWDDQLLVLHNGLTDELSKIPQMFLSGLWESVAGLQGDGVDYYRPLMLVSLAMDRAIAGESPIIAHLQSLLWHLGAVVLLYRLAARLLEDEVAAVAAAALFALHPAQAEAVQWVAARNDPMAAVFLLASLLVLSEEGRSPGRTALGALCALGALLCKESAALIPLLLIVVRQARGRGWGDAAAHLSLLMVFGVYLGLRAMAEVVAPSFPVQNLGLAAPALAFYAERLLAPWAVSPIMVLLYAPPAPWWALGALVALLGAALALGGRNAVAGLVFALLTWAPSLGGLLYTTEAASRYLYLPLAGLGLVLGAVIRGRRAAPVLALAVIVCLTAASARLLPRWRDDEALFGASLALWPSPYTHGAYAKVLEQQGRLDEAAEHYRAATAPPNPYPHSCENITAIHVARGDPASAVRDGTAALQAGCAPGPGLMGSLAVAEAMLGDWEAAERAAAAVSGDPSGRALLVKLAAAARRGDWAPLDQEIRRAPPGKAPQLIEQVARLLELAHEPELAAQVRARPAPSP